MTEQEDGKKRKHDPNFKGPIANRSCTDIPCCILFVAYIVGMIVVGIIAFKEGDPDRLLLPTDSQGNICGKGNFQDRKYLLFFDISTCFTKGGDLEKLFSIPSCPTPQVCIPKCPTENKLGTSRSAADMVCKEGIEPDAKSNKLTLVRQGKCAPYYLASKSVLYRCVPTLVGNLVDSNGTVIQNAAGNNLTSAIIRKGINGLKTLMNLQNFGLNVFEDMKAVWYWLLIGMILVMVLAFVYILITRWITGPLVWITIILVFALIIYGMYFCYSKYKFLNDSGTSEDFELKFTLDLDTYTKSKETWLGLGIVLTVLLVILLLIVLVLRKRIQIAIGMIKEASKAVAAVKTALFFPIIPWLLQLALFAWFLAVAVYLVTNGTAEYKVIDVPQGDQYNLKNISDCDPMTFETKYPNTSASCIMAGFNQNVHLFRMQVFHFFGWLWIMNFIIALGQCVLAGAFASWYFAFHKPDDVPALPIISSFWRTLRYHTGSLAFGAAIIAIVQFIRAVLEYIDNKLKEYGQDNKIVKFVLCCCKCCFWCLEKCLKFLNKNAYIVIAIHGKNFCSAAKEAFTLLLENVLRVVAVNSVTSFLLFMGKLLVVGIVGVASFFWFDKLNEDDPSSLRYDVVPTIVMVIFAYAVSVLFFDVYDMAIDTIFLCFLEDLEMNDGSAEKPYYMSDSLKKILHVQNRDQPDGTEEGETK